jgi:hypothetical protein
LYAVRSRDFREIGSPDRRRDDPRAGREGEEKAFRREHGFPRAHERVESLQLEPPLTVLNETDLTYLR